MPYMRNKRTGEMVEVDNTGNPVSRNAGPPMDPKFPYVGPQAAATLGQTGASTGKTVVDTRKTEQDIEHSAALFEAQRREAEAKAQLAQYQAQAAQAEMQSKNPLDPQTLGNVSADAMRKLQTIDRIRHNADTAHLPAIGWGAETMAPIGGTAAHNIRADIGSLKAGGALSEVLKMSQATGKNPFSPMSNSDVELIANNTANLDQGQSRDNFDPNLESYQGAYTRAYAGAEGMKTLNGEIERLLPTIAPDKREAFKQEALRQYNERVSKLNLGSPRPSRGRRPGGPPPVNNPAKFLGWED